LLINPNILVETLIDIIEYLSVVTVSDKTLKSFDIPEDIRKNFKGLTNKNIIEISNDLTNTRLFSYPRFEFEKSS
jgi:hypothetical protein